MPPDQPEGLAGGGGGAGAGAGAAEAWPPLPLASEPAPGQEGEAPVFPDLLPGKLFRPMAEWALCNLDGASLPPLMLARARARLCRLEPGNRPGWIQPTPASLPRTQHAACRQP
jgi:hypothetical protein